MLSTHSVIFWFNSIDEHSLPASSGGCALGSYISGSSVQLNAVCTDGFVFSSWSVMSVSQSGVQVSNSSLFTTTTGSSTQLFTASCSLNACYPFTVSLLGAGTVLVSPNFTSCSDSHSFPVGASLILTAIPAAGYALTSLSFTGTLNSSSNPFIFIMPAYPVNETANCLMCCSHSKQQQSYLWICCGFFFEQCQLPFWILPHRLICHSHCHWIIWLPFRILQWKYQPKY